MVNNSLIFCNTWEALPDDVKQDIRKFEYLYELTEKMLNLFEWEGLPDTIPDWMLEKYLILYGMAAIEKIDDSLYVGHCSYDGTLTKSGLPERLLVNYLDGTSSWIDVKEACYGFNTKTAFPDRIFLERYASAFSEIDLSILLNIIYSRNLPVPIVSSDIEKKNIDEVLKRARAGETSVFTTDAMKRFAEEGKIDAQLLKLFDVNNTQYSQELNLLHEEMLKRFCNECGIDINIRDKKAQMNSDEVNAYNDYCRITIDDKLNQRKLFADRINAKYGLNVSVKLKGFIEDNNIEDNEEEEDSGNDDKGADEVQEDVN